MALPVCDGCFEPFFRIAQKLLGALRLLADGGIELASHPDANVAANFWVIKPRFDVFAKCGEFTWRELGRFENDRILLFTQKTATMPAPRNQKRRVVVRKKVQ